MQAISFPEAPKVGGLETKLLVSPELFFHTETMAMAS